MPIHKSWVSMIKGMGKEYKEGKTKCRKVSDGSKVCVSEKAWQVFFAKINKDYSSGAEERPRSRSKNVGESQGELTDFEVDMYVNYFLKKKSDK